MIPLSYLINVEMEDQGRRRGHLNQGEISDSRFMDSPGVEGALAASGSPDPRAVYIILKS